MEQHAWLWNYAHSEKGLGISVPQASKQAKGISVPQWIETVSQNSAGFHFTITSGNACNCLGRKALEIIETGSQYQRKKMDVHFSDTSGHCLHLPWAQSP